MARIICTITFILLALTAGCRRDSGKPPAEVEALPVITSKTGGELLLIPGGSFTMGDAAGRDDETPHPVTVSAFYMDKHAVTQELYTKVMGTNPSKNVNVKCPVERTQWIDAARFCNKCSDLDELTPCYNIDTWECNFAADGYRLPTEAEWEYACRAGGTGRYGFGDEEKELLRAAHRRGTNGCCAAGRGMSKPTNAGPPIGTRTLPSSPTSASAPIPTASAASAPKTRPTVGQSPPTKARSHWQHGQVRQRTGGRGSCRAVEPWLPQASAGASPSRASPFSTPLNPRAKSTRPSSREPSSSSAIAPARSRFGACRPTARTPSN
ncbi:MAG: formylglycine-generating enzyme family protein [Planctomycetes bacterium]|nr:formylglycine-generating enzyme family protein [Planctomycetota bacterium]